LQLTVYGLIKTSVSSLFIEISLLYNICKHAIFGKNSVWKHFFDSHMAGPVDIISASQKKAAAITAAFNNVS
jgi:hypothetical protein